MKVYTKRLQEMVEIQGITLPKIEPCIEDKETQTEEVTHVEEVEIQELILLDYKSIINTATEAVKANSISKPLSSQCDVAINLS